MREPCSINSYYVAELVTEVILRSLKLNGSCPLEG